MLGKVDNSEAIWHPCLHMVYLEVVPLRVSACVEVGAQGQLVLKFIAVGRKKTKSCDAG